MLISNVLEYFLKLFSVDRTDYISIVWVFLHHCGLC